MFMAASTTSDFLAPAFAATVSPAVLGPRRRRRITPQAGRALEILGHAIEYLTDEFVHERKPLSADNQQIMAVQLLMAVNRQIYYECPPVLTLRERCRAALHF
jgi:hypothetical protein